MVLDEKLSEEDCINHELKNIHHAYALSENLCKLRQLDILCDITLVCQKKEIKAHKLILAACSEYFQVMFTSDMCEKQKEEVTLKDVNHEALSLLINYCYTGVLLLNELNVQIILETSDLLQFNSAKLLCCDYIKENLTIENCLEVFQFASVYHCDGVVDVSQNMFNKHWQELINRESFWSLHFDIVVKLISSDLLYVNKESDVLKMVLRWIYGPDGIIENRLHYLSHLLEYIRWSYIEPTELKDILKTSPILEDFNVYQIVEGFIPTQYFERSPFPMRKSYEKWVYVLGGEQSFLMELKSCEFFSNEEARWDYGFSLHGPRTSFAAVVNAGKLYVIGGMRFGEKLRIVECFDPKEAHWKRLSSLRKCQGGVEAAIVDDVVYVAGGSSDGEPACRYVEKFDESNNQWQTVANMRSRRRRFGICSLGSKLYVFGGFQDSNGELKSCEMYDTDANAWSAIAPMSTNRCDLGVTVQSGYIYVSGGVNSYTGSICTVERYNPNNDTWVSCKNMLQARGGHAMTSFFGRIIAIGGTNSYMQTCQDAEWYDEVKDEWKNLQSINMPRFGGVAVVLPFCKRPRLRERDAPG